MSKKKLKGPLTKKRKTRKHFQNKLERECKDCKGKVEPLDKGRKGKRGGKTRRPLCHGAVLVRMPAPASSSTPKFYIFNIFSFSIRFCLGGKKVSGAGPVA